jgi:hypothetical protein
LLVLGIYQTFQVYYLFAIFKGNLAAYIEQFNDLPIGVEVGKFDAFQDLNGNHPDQYKLYRQP